MIRFFITFFVPPLTLLLIYAFVFMSLRRKEKRDEQLKRTYTKLYGGWMYDINGNVVPEYIPNAEEHRPYGCPLEEVEE